MMSKAELARKANVTVQTIDRIEKGNDCVSTSPISELITVVKVKVLAPGFEKILLIVTICEFPLVTLLLSGTDCAKILIPPATFEMVNVPNDNPVAVFIDWIIA